MPRICRFVLENQKLDEGKGCIECIKLVNLAFHAHSKMLQRIVLDQQHVTIQQTLKIWLNGRVASKSQKFADISGHFHS